MKALHGAIGLLMTAGVCLGGKQPPVCPWDCASPGNNAIDTVDFFELIAQWGLSGTSCDFGSGNPGVSTADFFDLIGRWGPCPAPPNDECTGAIIACLHADSSNADDGTI